MDLAGKEGGVHKSGYIFTAAGMFTLNIHAELPPDPTGNRTMNQALAAQNRQVVFQGDCAACHATPTVGKTGKALADAESYAFLVAGGASLLLVAGRLERTGDVANVIATRIAPLTRAKIRRHTRTSFR